MVNTRYQRLGLAVALLGVCALVGYLLYRGPSQTATIPAERSAEPASGVQAHVRDKPAAPAFMSDEEREEETPVARTERAQPQTRDWEQAVTSIAAPDQPAPEEVLTLTPRPVMDDIQPYRARFQPAGKMELVNLPSLARIVRQRPTGDAPRILNLPIPDGHMVSVEVLRHDRIALERGVFIGRVTDQPLSEVIISYYEDAMTASMIVPGVGHYEIAYAGDDRYLLMEIDPDRLLPEAPPRVPPRPEHDERMAP